MNFYILLASLIALSPSLAIFDLDFDKIIYNFNKEIVEMINRENLEFKLALNDFSYMDAKTFTQRYCGAKLPKQLAQTSLDSLKKLKDLKNLKAPASVDWRHLLQPVINQKNCGSCWSFTTMALIEAHNKKKNPKWNTQLSPQYLVDCDGGNKKCDGGWPTEALSFLKDTSSNMAPSISTYPYLAKNGVCQKQCKSAFVKLNIEDYYEVSLNGDEELLKAMVAHIGPVSVSMHVNKDTGLFQHYKSGVFYERAFERIKKRDQCNAENVNHSVLLVGYGETKDAKKTPYWLIKNSFGKSWGEDGFIRIARNRNNNCGIACFAHYVELL